MYTDVSHKIQDTPIYPIYNLVCITFKQSGLQDFWLFKSNIDNRDKYNLEEIVIAMDVKGKCHLKM